jgi:transposase
MNCAWWTPQAGGELIGGRFGVRLAVRAVGELLKRWGFRPQRRLKKAYAQPPETVQKWETENIRGSPNARS